MDFVELGANIRARRAEEDEAQLRHTQAYVAPTTTPEAAAEKLKLARENNTTTDVVGSDLDGFYQRRAAKAQDWRKLMAERPATAAIAADSETGAAVADDLDNLSTIEKVWKSTGEKYGVGEAQSELADIGARMIRNEESGEDHERARHLQEQLKRPPPDYDFNWFTGVPGEVAQQIPLYVDVLTDAWDEALVGAGFGAAEDSAPS